MKKILIILTFALIVGCNKENKSTVAYSSIDLSVMYNNSINSYKIEVDSSVVILLNTKDEMGRLYKSTLNKVQFESIQNEISQIYDIPCDSTTNHYADGMNYVLVIKRNGQKITLVSNTCDKYEKIDNFVLHLVKMLDKQKKHEFFESVILPPPPPPELP